MEEALDPSVIKTTQLSLGKYVKRPPLTDKLLRKPPFRFLHDIITSVLKTTGFFNGLFDEDELVSDNVKDRDSKISFLNKVIFVVGTTIGKNLTVKSSKIVAGQEPEKSNELLQCLALALDSKLSSDDAVKQYKESTKGAPAERKVKNASKPVNKASDTKKNVSKVNENTIKSDKNANRTVKKKESSSIKKDSPPKKLSQISKVVDKKESDNRKSNLKENTALVKKISVINIEVDKLNEDDCSEKMDSEQQDMQNIQLVTNNEDVQEIIEMQKEKIENNDINSISQEQIKNESKEDTLFTDNKDHDKTVDVVNTMEQLINNEDKNEATVSNNSSELKLKNDQETLENYNGNISISETPIQLSNAKASDTFNFKRPPSMRPSSSRPGAPRLREKHDNIIDSTDNLVGKVNIISENTEQEDEEPSVIIVDTAEALSKLPDDEEHLKSSDEHGHLVQQILDAQKEFSQVTGKTDIEWQFGAQKARDLINQEIEQLRFNVQALSRVANPLGKILDHIQEDVEVMRQELVHWTQTYQDASKELLKQKAANEESLNPLYTKIKQLDADIMEKHDKINDLKVVIHKNSFRIEKLLTNGNVQ